MPHDARMYLQHILDACGHLTVICQDKTFEKYSADLTCRSAVERQLITIGEAVNKLMRLDEGFADRIEHAVEIVAFRNVLVHGYDIVRDDRVWDVVRYEVPALKQQVALLLDELNR